MTSASWVLLVLAGVAAAGDWLVVSGLRPDLRRLEYATKPAVPVLLAGTALALHPADPALRAVTVGFLLLCLVGDVLLMLPGDSTGLFAGGLGAFLAAHVLLIVGLLASMDGGGASVVRALVGLVVVTAVPAGTVVRAVARDHRPLLVPVVVYVAVLLVMGAVAVAAGAGAGRAANDPALIVGALAFIASDTMLAVDRFVRPLPRATLLVHSTYHLALGALVVSLVSGG
jgi:uncharacterized membrane protein YhhN